MAKQDFLDEFIEEKEDELKRWKFVKKYNQYRIDEEGEEQRQQSMAQADRTIKELENMIEYAKDKK